jgi:hypothetical protein
MQQLPGVVPIVERLGGVDALVALHPDGLPLKDPGQGVGDLGLADAGHAFEQQRLAELQRKIERGHQRLVGEIAGRGERSVERAVAQG